MASIPDLSMLERGDLEAPSHAVRREVGVDDARDHAAPNRRDDPHLRSCRAVIGYHIKASDGESGHVQGMLVDEETWAVRYLVVDTSIGAQATG